MLFEHDEPSNSRLDRSAGGQDTVVLHDKRLVLGSERPGNVVTLLIGEDYTAKVLVQLALAEEGTAVLSGNLNVASKRREGLAVDAVRVARSVQVWSGSVDGVVDGKCGLVVDAALRTAAGNNVTGRANEQEVLHRHEAEGHAERVNWAHMIDPKRFRTLIDR